jgi:tetratricopeptide (TPR) repeat protein
LAGAWNATTDALQLRPFHPEAYLLLAEIAQSSGNTGQALELARHAARLAPGWKPAQNFLKAPAPAASPATSATLPPGAHPLPVSQRPRLSVCLITKNEEQFLKRCLESVRDLASQIVVVDTGSTDSTRSIAGHMGAEVSTFAWCDDFSAARNAALERATGDWVLILDADEELRPDQRVRLRRLLDDTSAIAFRLPLVDVDHEDEGTHYVPRLFRNAPGLHFIGRIHEDVFSSVERLRVEWGLQNKLGDAQLLHHGYTDAVRKSRSKGDRNLRLLRLELKDRPNDPNLLMSLGAELARAGRLAEALPQYEAALRSTSAQPPDSIAPEFRETLLTQYGTHLLKAKEYAGLARLLRSPLARAGELTATLHWMAGLACIEQRQFAEGAEHMRQCLALRRLPTLTPVDKNILKGGPYHCLARCQMALSQPQDARYAFESALIEEPESRSIRLDYARFLAAEGQEVEALQWLHALIAEDASDVQVWHLGGQVALSKPELLEFAGDWTLEAMKCHGQQSAIIEQRASALLLSGQPEKALPLWQSFNGNATSSQRAATLICEASLSPRLKTSETAPPGTIDREFVNWYRRLLDARAVGVIKTLNQRMEPLRPIVPGAVQVLEKALAEVEVGLTE